MITLPLTLSLAHAAPWTETSWDTRGSGYPVQATDLDGDGWGEVLVPVAGAVDTYRGPLMTWYGAVGVVGNLLAVSDLDGDGDDDLLLGDDGLYVIENLGSMALGAEVPLTPVVFDNVRKVVIGDLDGDGDMDFVVRDDVALWRIETSGGSRIVTELAGLPVYVAALADLDGDGLLDLIYEENDHISWSRSVGSAFDPPVSACPHELTDPVAVDFDLDGDLDIVTGDDRRLTWCENVGGATFLAPVTLTDFGPDAIVRTVLGADLDGDVDPDFVVETSPSGFVTLENTGGALGGSIGDPLPEVAITEVYDVRLQHMDADHAPDLVMGGARMVAFPDGWVPFAAVLLNPGFPDADGDGLSDAAEARYGTDPTSADTDGDGASDYDELAAGTDPDSPPPTTGATGDTAAEPVPPGETADTGSPELGGGRTCGCATPGGPRGWVLAILAALVCMSADGRGRPTPADQ